LSSLTLFLESAFEAVLLDGKERLELSQVFLRLLLHFLHLLFELLVLLIEFTLKFKVSLFGPVFALFE
jgi:hypothetical protein